VILPSVGLATRIALRSSCPSGRRAQLRPSGVESPRILLTLGIDLLTEQGDGSKLAGTHDVTTQVMREIAVADFSTLKGGDREVLIPLGEWLIVHRLRLQVQKVRRLARRKLRLMQELSTAALDQTQLLQAKRHRFNGDEIEMVHSPKIGSLEVARARHDIVEPLSDGTRRYS
jgi:hypothetical protein